jgi:hypothetical protein
MGSRPKEEKDREKEVLKMGKKNRKNQRSLVNITHITCSSRRSIKIYSKKGDRTLIFTLFYDCFMALLHKIFVFSQSYHKV